jgi:hypothetical protein
MKKPIQRWLGVGKLVEEFGEVLQLIGKGIAFPVGDHPDGKGSILDRLPEELADAKASIQYFEEVNGIKIDDARVKMKLKRFHKWGLSGLIKNDS